MNQPHRLLMPGDTRAGSWRVDRPAGMFLAFVTLSIISAVIWVGYIMVTMRHVSDTNADTHAQADATLFARLIEDRIVSVEHGASTQAHDVELVDTLRTELGHPSVATHTRLEERLRRVTDQIGVIRGATLVDAAGRLVASSLQLTLPVGTDFSKRDWFRGVHKRDPYTSGAFASLQDGTRITATAARVTDANGHLIGVLVLTGGPQLQTVVDHLSEDASTSLFVADAAGHIVAATGQGATGIATVDDFAGLRRSFALMGGATTRSQGYLVVQRPVGDSSWRVFVRTREAQARGPVDMLSKKMVVTYGLGLALWLVLAWAVARWLSRAELAAERAAAATSARSKLSAIDSARTRERERIAEELHDTSLQLMNAALMQLDTADVLINRRDDQQAFEQGATAMKTSRSLVRDAIRGVRRVLLGLAALDVDHLALSASIELVAQRAANAANVELDVDVRGVDSVTEPTRSTVYRLASELVSNAVRHGQPGHVRVEVHGDPEAVTIVVEDDGRGFAAPVTSMDHIPEGVGIGLRTLVRLHETGVVEVDVRSMPDQGTWFHIVVPVLSSSSVDEGESVDESHA